MLYTFTASERLFLSENISWAFKPSKIMTTNKKSKFYCCFCFKINKQDTVEPLLESDDCSEISVATESTTRDVKKKSTKKQRNKKSTVPSYAPSLLEQYVASNSFSDSHHDNVQQEDHSKNSTVSKYVSKLNPFRSKKKEDSSSEDDDDDDESYRSRYSSHAFTRPSKESVHYENTNNTSSFSDRSYDNSLINKNTDSISTSGKNSSHSSALQQVIKSHNAKIMATYPSLEPKGHLTASTSSTALNDASGGFTQN